MEAVKQILPFDTRAAFQAQLRVCLAEARHTLHMFDPDFALWELGHSEVDALLRRFLAGHGRLELVAHGNAELERGAPRFLRLLKDYRHAIDCRLTPANLRLLTDSFCIADQRHLVRRFHADHLRGVAIFHAPDQIQDQIERFSAIWAESMPGLRTGTTGL